jgi:hypothetical protein
MTLETLLQVISKHGAVGVLAVWILTLHSEVKQMKNELIDCLKHEQITEKTNHKNERYERAYFVLPEKKRRKDEYCLTYDC